MKLNCSLQLILAVALLPACLAPKVETESESTRAPRKLIAEHPRAPFPYSDLEQLGLSKHALRELGDQVGRWVDDGQVVGAEVLIVKRGQIAWHEVFGYRDLETREPLAAGGIFRIRSMTKPMIGTLALRLVDRGVLGLDDLASKYIPALDHDNGKLVTIRMLLEHTSGYEFSPFPRARDSYESLRASVDDLAKKAPQHPPGEFRYSDAGTATLGAIVSAAAGVPLEELLQCELFDPLGMETSYTSFEVQSPWRDSVNSTHAWNYDSQSHERYWHSGEPQEMPYFRASGGVYTSVFDYALFLESWCAALAGQENSLVSESILREALTQGNSAAYGLHWEVVNDSEGDPILFGHGGSDGTLAIAIPDEDALLLFFTQSRACDCMDQFAMLAGRTGQFGALSDNTTWGRWRDRAPELELTNLDEATRELYIGKYAVNGTTFEVIEREGHLRLTRTAIDDSGPAIRCIPALAPPFESLSLIPLSQHRFALGKIEGDRIVETYWPNRHLEFVFSGKKVIGYELLYDPDAVERARRYEWRLEDPVLARVPLLNELAGKVDGKYESGTWSTEVTSFADYVELVLADRNESFIHQGAGFFLNETRDVLTFSHDLESRRWSLKLLTIDGQAHVLQRWSDE